MLEHQYRPQPVSGVATKLATAVSWDSVIESWNMKFRYRISRFDIYFQVVILIFLFLWTNVWKSVAFISLNHIPILSNYIYPLYRPLAALLRIYRGSEGALDKNYTHNINLNHWPIRYISMPLHIIAGRRWNTSADPINQSKRCPVRGIYTIMIVKSPSLLVQTWGAAIAVSANTGRPPWRRHVFFRAPPCFANWRPQIDASWGQFRGTRGLGSALVFRRLPAIACNSRTPALVGPRTHQFSRVRAPVEKKQNKDGGAPNKDGGAH